MNVLRLCVIVFILHGMSAACFAWSGKVIGVPEGDLLVILHGDREKRVRLYGIDCPERGQPFWDKAQALVKFLTEDRVVEVNPLFLGVEGYDKVLVRIEGTKDYLNLQLIAYGLAWVKPRECCSRMCTEWKRLQKMARTRKVGLWADRSPIAPWDWRRVQWLEILNNKREK